MLLHFLPSGPTLTLLTVAQSNDTYIIRSSFVHPPPLVAGRNRRRTNPRSSAHCSWAEPVVQPRPVSGPSFKIYWNGSAGGKTNAASILTDEDFNMNKAALSRKRVKPEVCVEFNHLDLEAFRIQEVAAQTLASASGVANDEAPELAYGTQVPQLSSFTTNAQLHGVYIMELKRKHRCDQHCGEHGEPGYCYVASDGTHIRLNMHRLRLWAAAWAAGEATKYQPPNGEAFDGARDSGPPVRPRVEGDPIRLLQTPATVTTYPHWS
ncbi:hypothetical protein NMY22_g17640 [Coprinellus aureogranulatus]|nr:hypothetical protein NMY22_g17640 [Coprinellus aureogranulatus]